MLRNISFKSLFKKNLLSGILVLIPLLVILWLAHGLLGWIWGLVELLPQQLQPQDHWSPTSAWLIKLVAMLGITFVILAAISLLGFFSKLYMGKKLLTTIGEWLQKIPVLGTIYSALDQLLKTIAQGGGKQFSRVVYIEFPRKEVWVVAFVTGPVKSAAFPAGYLNVFVPAVPNPTSGFHLLVPEKEVRETGLSVEEAFRMILSLGLVQPRHD